MCEFPNVIGTMKVMEDNHLARFSHTYPGKVRKEGGFTTAAQFTTDDKKLQLGRFYYTMNSTLNHFEKCFNTARVLLYNGMYTFLYQSSASKLVISQTKAQFLSYCLDLTFLSHLNKVAMAS